MKYYINLNTQPNGDNEIHKEICYYYKIFRNINFKLLGVFSSEKEALKFAKKNYPTLKADGCYNCCKSIHKH